MRKPDAYLVDDQTHTSSMSLLLLLFSSLWSFVSLVELLVSEPTCAPAPRSGVLDLLLPYEVKLAVSWRNICAHNVCVVQFFFVRLKCFVK